MSHAATQIRAWFKAACTGVSGLPTAAEGTPRQIASNTDYCFVRTSTDAVEALTGVDVVSSNATTRTLTIRTWTGTVATPVVTGATSAVTGGTAVTVAAQFGTSLKLRGVAMHQHKEPIADLVRYEVKDPVSAMTSGRIFVKNADTVVAHKPAYLTATGTWTDETVAGSVSNLSTPYYFRSNVSGAGLALLEVVEKPAN